MIYAVSGERQAAAAGGRQLIPTTYCILHAFLIPLWLNIGDRNEYCVSLVYTNIGAKVDRAIFLNLTTSTQ